MKLTFKQQFNNELVQKQLDQIDYIDELKQWMSIFLNESIVLMDHISNHRQAGFYQTMSNLSGIVIESDKY